MTDRNEPNEGTPSDSFGDIDALLTEEERKALRALDPPSLPRGLERKIVRVLRSEGLVQGGWPAWLPPLRVLGASAALACTFTLGVLVGRSGPTGDRLVSSQARDLLRAEDSRAAASAEGRVPRVMTQFYQDGTDPFQHYSIVEEHPQSSAVLVKTWQY